MNSLVKWIGGGTLGVLLMLASAVVTDQALQAMNPPASKPIATGKVLTENDPAVTAPVRVAQPAPNPKPVEPFTIKRILPIDGPIKYGQWFWDDKGVPQGPLVITVDLDARVLSVFRDGYEIGATAVLLGTSAHPTPLGTFPILSKERHNVSKKYGDAPMPWSLRLTGDGVAIHGGHAVELGWASHGCIGAPNPFMTRLFAIAKVGDKAIITRGKRAGLGDALIAI
ncbi:MAG TPA: L,D-transpeptidase family protein [Croceibacterium sp.]|nr:L,D-transpeptidase family protein [Croceibacterium sp.]